MQVGVKVDDHGAEAAMRAAFDSLLASAVQQATKTVSDLAKADMAGPQGLTSFPTHARGTQTPAKPGGPPAQITGALARSVKAQPVRKTKKAISTGKVGPTLKYARPLDRGSLSTRAHTINHGTDPFKAAASRARVAANIAKAGGRVQPAYPIIAGTRQRLLATGKAQEVYVKALGDVIIPTFWRR